GSAVRCTDSSGWCGPAGVASRRSGCRPTSRAGNTTSRPRSTWPAEWAYSVPRPDSPLVTNHLLFPEALVEEGMDVMREVGRGAVDVRAVHDVGHVVVHGHPGRLRHHLTVELAI